MRERTCVSLWLIRVDIWQKSLQYCKIFIFQLKIRLGERKKKEFLEG